jgi:hypothetical protein
LVQRVTAAVEKSIEDVDDEFRVGMPHGAVKGKVLVTNQSVDGRPSRRDPVLGVRRKRRFGAARTSATNMAFTTGQKILDPIPLIVA